ncbi:MAG: cysteine--tRNA ligase [Planctomycetota bacterium]
MTIRVYDSLSRQKRDLVPLEPGLVRMYLCGPTVYDDSHIGHLMGPVLFDTIARWLIARGYRVKFVINITDIDDKIIQRAQRSGEDWRAIAERYTTQYFALLDELRVVTVTDNPRCTDYVPQMLHFVHDLVAKDRAYVTSDGVYYDVLRQPGYGKLSGRRVEDMIAGARVEASEELRHPADFALWKAAKPGEPTWDSEFGKGRPGWHLECSVMASELLGETFDIHGGGDDLKFPHHENEIAQSEAHGDHYARCWMHNGLVQYGGKKVAKSDPRMKDPQFALQFQGRWLLDHHGAPTIRFFLLRGHYRRPIDFEPKNVDAARTGLIRLLRQLGAIAEEPGQATLAEIEARDLPPQAAAHRARFVAAMDDDFNTAEAIAEIFAMANLAAGLDGDARVQVQRALRDLGRLLGLFAPGDLARIDRQRDIGAAGRQVVAAVVDLRNRFRTQKDFAGADALRQALAGAGITVKDGATGAEIAIESDDAVSVLLDRLVALRDAARARKDFAGSDAIRDALTAAGVKLKDGVDGTRWEL